MGFINIQKTKNGDFYYTDIFCNRCYYLNKDVLSKI